MKLIKDKESKKVFEDENGVRFYECKKGEILGDNNINPKELIYLVSGSVELDIDGNLKKIDYPAKIEIPEKTYHKIEAVEDIKFLLFSN